MGVGVGTCGASDVGGGVGSREGYWYGGDTLGGVGEMAGDGWRMGG